MLEIKATLRISSKCLTLDKLKQVLGQPTKGHSIGDNISRGNTKREFSYWGWELPPEKRVSLESHIGKLLKILDDKKESIDVIRDQIEIDIFCCLSSDNGQGGAIFSAGLIKLLELYNIDVVLDLYMDPED